MTQNRNTLIEGLREPDRYGQSYDDKCEAADEIERLRAALVEARQWLGDGCNADGLHRDLWTPAYRAVIDKIDSVLDSNHNESHA